MKRRTFLGVAGTALTATAAAGLFRPTAAAAAVSGAEQGRTENAVLELERTWMNAMVQRDEPTLRNLMADDFKRVEKPWPNISMFKPQWIGNAVRLTRIETFRHLTMSVRVSGNRAVVATRYRWRGVIAEVPINEIVTAQDTWEQRSGRWQIIQQFISHTGKVGATDKPTARRRAIRVDPAIYLAYVGRYQFGPSRILTIKHEGGRLIHEGSGGHRAELLPETQTRFFRRDISVLTTFVQKDGQVTHVVHRHTNGRESTGKRIA
jgi:hypothetical protein